MATIKFYDEAGATTHFDLIGETGLVNTENLIANYSSYRSDRTHTSSTLTESLYTGDTLSYVLEFDYTEVTSPSPDLNISTHRLYDGSSNLLQQWSSANLSTNEIFKTDSFAILQGEDTIEGNIYANYLQGALGDDTLKGLAGDDTLDGGRADDILWGGSGDDILYGGLGTDTAIFLDDARLYGGAINSDGSISISYNGSGEAEGIDKLYDIEYLTFNYGTGSEYSIDVTKFLYGVDSLINGVEEYTPDILFSKPELYLAHGSKYTFSNNTNQISWAIAENSSNNWHDVDIIQDIFGHSLEEFSKVTNINFKYNGYYNSILSANNDNVDFIFTPGDFASPNVLAAAFFPYFEFNGQQDNTIDYGLIFSSSKYFDESWFERNLIETTIHEVGHSLGLKHPHDASWWNDNTVGGRANGADAPFNQEDEYSTLFTMMSYTRPAGILSNDGYNAVTPMSYDISVLQELYGTPSYSGNDGDSEHAIVSSKTYSAIYETNGNDTISAQAAETGWFIQLSDSDVAETRSYAYGTTYPGTQMVVGVGSFENAIGSIYNDQIAGSLSQNTITGGKGDDLIAGLGGADELDGGEGNDWLYFKQDVSSLQISYSSPSVLSFQENETNLGTATNFESFAFGLGTNNYYGLSFEELESYITDTAATVSTNITGTVKEGQRLGLDISISDPDGVDEYSIQWQSKIGSGSWTNLSGETSAYLMLDQSHVGASIRTEINYKDKLGHTEQFHTTASSTVQNLNDAHTGSVSLSGTFKLGEVITADTSQIADKDGIGSFSYEWQSSSDEVSWSAISGATSSSLTISEAQAYHSIRVKVQYQDGNGTTEYDTSQASGIINPGNFSATGQPVISALDNIIIEGSTLSSNISSISDRDGMGSLNYQWQQSVSGNWVDISSANQAIFIPTDNEVGNALHLKVSFTDNRENNETVYSTQTAVVQNVNDTPLGSVSIKGNQIEGSVLTLSDNITDADGLGTFSYQWQTSSNLSSWSDITGSTTSSLTLDDIHVGKYLRAEISFTDGHGTSETVYSAATSTIINKKRCPNWNCNYFWYGNRRSSFNC